MSATNQDIIYADFQNAFTVHPIKKDLPLSYNEDAVKRSLINIVQTNYYERPFRPRFGANVRKYLFENLTPITLDAIKAAIITAIGNDEPRARLIDVVVSSTEANTVNVTITFSTINSLQPIIVNTTLSLERVR